MLIDRLNIREGRFRENQVPLTTTSAQQQNGYDNDRISGRQYGSKGKDMCPQPDNLSSIPRIHVVEGKGCPVTSTHCSMGIPVPMYTHNN